MSNTEPEFEVVRELVQINHKNNSISKDVYSFTPDQMVHLDGFLYTPKGRPSKTLLIYMHPAATNQLVPLPTALVKAGCHVLFAGGRYTRNDSALIMENVLLDFAAYMNHARNVWGYEKVVVAGWSGGGSLTAFYQAQAEKVTVVATPSGEEVDLTGMLSGDAMMFHAAHLSRAECLRDWIDPSVLDENNPDIRDAELDLYSPRNPNRPPYSPDYITYYRAAQLARLRRRTALVKELLHELSGRAKEAERGIVTHRTLADPRFLDGTLDPNDRPINWCFLGDPEAANTGIIGAARFSTLRGWLSQWSVDDTNAHALKHAPNISVPLLAIENSADDVIPQPHTKKFFDAYAGKDKVHLVIKGGNHFYGGQPKQLKEATDTVTNWLREKQFMD